jgi:probable FeS assembly SUF system protein SufT
MEDFILLKRNVEATQIPSGQLVHLPEGTPVSITQALGGTFTVHASPGGLYRIGAADADALGKEPLAKGEVAAGPYSEELVWAALREVYDPEIPVNIVDLGLVYDLSAEPVGEGEGRKVTVQMTLTAPGCGMGPSLAADARQRLSVLPGVTEADVLLVWDPPWGPERISPEGRAKLGID